MAKEPGSLKFVRKEDPMEAGLKGAENEISAGIEERSSIDEEMVHT